MKRLTLLSVSLASVLFANDNVYKLGRIEVVDTAEIAQNRTIGSVSFQDMLDSSSKNIVQALELVPGISTIKAGRKNLTEVRIRGFNNKRVPLFIDGIPVYVPYNRETDLGRYTVYDLSEIMVSKSYVSPMYGPNTIGGAINLVTKKPTSEFEGELGGSVFNGKGRESFLTIGSSFDKFYGILSISNFQRDYMRMSNDFTPAGQEDGGKRENSDSKDFKANIKIGYTPNDTDEYSFNYIAQRAQKGNPFYASDYEGGQEGYKKGFRTRYWRWANWDKTSYYLITKTQVNEDLLIKSRWYYDKFFNELNDLGTLPKAKNNPKLRWASEYDDYSIGGNLEANYNINENHILKFALFQKNDYHEQYDPKDPNSNIKAQGYTQSAGLEYSWKINDKLTWIVAGSFDRYKTTKAEYEKGKTKGEWDTQTTDIFTPQSIIYYQALKDTMLYASIGQRSNMPSLSQRFSTRFGGYIPNPNLKAETATNYEIGIHQNLSQKHFLSAALFYTKTDDYIGTLSVAPQNGVCEEDCEQNQNIGEEEHKGFEIGVDSFWLDSISTKLSYAFIDPELKKSDKKVAKYILGIPKHSLSAMVKFEPFKNFYIIPLLRYESSAYVDMANSSPKRDAFTTLDISLAYKFDFGLELNAGVKNISDEDYYYTLGHPEEGRTYHFGFRYSF